MIIKKKGEVAPVEVQMEGAEDVSVRVLFGPKDKAPTFAMRQFELAPGGHTPHHTHPFEHQIVCLAGRIAVVSEDGETPVTPGDVALVMPDELHQFRNISDTESATMLCFVPIEYQP